MKLITILFIISITTACSDFSNSESLKNVSTLITLERQVQIANQTEAWNSVSSHKEIEELLQDKTAAPQRSFRLIETIKQMENIDKESNLIISEIDNLKLELLKTAGESTETFVKNNQTNIVIHKSKMNDFYGEMMRLNLTGIQDKLNTNSVEKVIFSNSTDEKLWNHYNVYIKSLLKTLSTYSEKRFSFNPTMSYNGPTFEEYIQQFEKDLYTSKANIQDDQGILTQLFVDLFKPNKVKNEKGSFESWMEYKFKDATIISALSELTALQNDILKSKSAALRHIKSRSNICEGYSFTNFIPIVSGPSNIEIGKEVELKVRMGAYDVYSTPIITSSRPSVTVDSDGSSTIRFKAKKGINSVKGTIAIKKKSGEISVQPWEWSVYGVQ